MIFSSHLFLFVFLPAALALYFLVPRWAKHLMLTLLSYAFYGWANPLFVVLMFSSTLIDYSAGLSIAEAWGKKGPIQALAPGARSRRQKTALLISILSNLSLLGFFKYFNFGVESYDTLVQTMGWEAARLDLWIRITLPVGISFYTLQSMSYSIDVYRGQARAMRSFVDFACFVSMFPQLVAGPIVRFQEVSEQLAERRHSLEKFSRGVAFICMGMAKKILLANTCGKIADTVFDAGLVGAADAWSGAVAVTLQYYFDFSGYSDMAIGLGLILGFTFPKNFDSPLIAQSFTEYWRRNHLSLSTFLRDYLYIPMGGSRHGPTRTSANLWTVMLVGGLWHGAAWHFVIWGALHGLMLSIERLLGRTTVYRGLPRPLRIGLTFALLVFTFVAFRVDNFGELGQFWAAMLGFGSAQAGAVLLGGLIYGRFYLGWLLIALAVTFFGVQTWDFTKHITWPRVGLVLGAFAASVLLLMTQAYNPFLYFMF
ncbi:MAG: MBOAT family protein [Deltaproteobacteria bacterium]|nr:MBOAT family protein [Deltaproteobacteria bacterium]